jgi:hypothetical protein
VCTAEWHDLWAWLNVSEGSWHSVHWGMSMQCGPRSILFWIERATSHRHHGSHKTWGVPIRYLCHQLSLER